MKQLRVVFITLISLLATPHVDGAETTIETQYLVLSPQRSVSAEVSVNDDGRLNLVVRRHGRAVIEEALIGVTVDGVDLGKDVTLGETSAYTVDETYAWRGVKSQVRNHAHGKKFEIAHPHQNYSLEVRAYDEGVGWRCTIPGEGQRTVQGEATAFRLPSDASYWAQTNTVNYEAPHNRYSVGGEPPGETIGMPVTVVLPNGGYASISEADMLHYSGMTLRASRDGTLSGRFGDDPNGWTMRGAFSTPWRLVIAVDDLDALVNADLVHNLAPAPDKKLFSQGVDTDWLTHGRMYWLWWVESTDSGRWDRQKSAVDEAVSMNCSALQIDDRAWESPDYGWADGGRSKWDRMRELVDYAGARGVKIWVWRSLLVEHGPGLLNKAQCKEFIRQCAEAGVTGVKIDFFDSESHDKLALAEDCLRLAARHKLMVNIHGVWKPTGEVRTWPNEVTREGILGMEHALWSDIPLGHYASVPFTRLIAGHGDVTPGVLRPKALKNVTAAQQLAYAVIVTSPLLFLGDTADGYHTQPPEVLEIVRHLPTAWDETRVLPCSDIGNLAAFARRKGKTWYLAIVGGETPVGAGEPQVLRNVSLGFLGEGDYEAMWFFDDKENTDLAIKHRDDVNAKTTLDIPMRPGGGFLGRITPRP